MSKRPWHLDRRQLLRGAGATLALPLLESMTGGAAPDAEIPGKEESTSPMCSR